jgi:hypothetical protein
MNHWFDKLKSVARAIADDRPKLHFFGLVHPVEAPNDRWDLLVSSDKLTPWNADSIRYVVNLLNEQLSPEEIVKIATVVTLPKDNDVVVALSKGVANSSNGIRGLRPIDDFDGVEVIWPAKKSGRAA